MWAYVYHVIRSRTCRSLRARCTCTFTTHVSTVSNEQPCDPATVDHVIMQDSSYRNIPSQSIAQRSVFRGKCRRISSTSGSARTGRTFSERLVYISDVLLKRKIKRGSTRTYGLRSKGVSQSRYCSAVHNLFFFLYSVEPRSEERCLKN